MQWVIAFFIALLFGALIGHYLIPFLRRLKFGQEVRDEGPESHLKKQGTPTMGGILFFCVMPLAVFASLALNAEGLFLLASALLFGLIGFIDDMLKIVAKRSLGLRAWQKIALQLFVVVVILFWGVKGLGLAPAFWIPGSETVLSSAVFYVLFMVVVLIGTTNSANLTDGLDGLLASVTFVVSLGYFFIAYMMNLKPAMAFAAALAGLMIAFLRYNRHPAQMFMGDTGSFFIGGAVAGMAMVTKTELLLLLICVVYVMEALSVMIQVSVFKKTGRRVFKMSPLHHHFELSGLSETQVVMLFSLISLVAAIISLLIMKHADLSILQELRG